MRVEWLPPAIELRGFGMTRRMFLLYFVLLFAILLSWEQNASLAQVQRSEPMDMSIVQLIANPSKYHGKLVRVIGFCRLEFEGNALFLHREDFEQGLTKNGVWLDIGWPVPENYRSLSDGYVLVEAVFDAEEHGHMGLFSGELKKVTRMNRWSPRRELEGRNKPESKQ
jgi:hypothetical protein